MKIVELQQESGLDALRLEWNGVLAESVSKNIFLTWEWITAWWSAYGADGELNILLAYDDAGVLRGIAPLRRRTNKRFGQTVPELSFIGDGSNDTDYLDFIVAAGWEESVSAAFRERLAAEMESGTVLLLNEIPATSPNLNLLRDLAGAKDILFAESEVSAGTVKLPESWDAFLGLLKSRFRTKVRSVLRNLESREAVRFGFCQTHEQVEKLLPVLYDLHTRRWAMEAKPGVFGSAAKRDFYTKLSRLLLDRGWLRFSWLEWNGQVLACQYGFEYGGTYFHLQEGYEPAAEHWNVGVGLRAWTIREFQKQGVKEYDFLGGVGRHKLDWGAEVKQSKLITLASSRHMRNVLFCRGPEWEERAKEKLKPLLPQKLLEARRKRHEERARAASEPSQNGAASSPVSWRRRAGAGCYFHSPLPALTRPLRERYQISRAQGFSIRRRTEPCVRILIYHRVNNENNRFFPSITTESFETHISYVARNYRVVSLLDAVKHLESGSPELVFAVTFDDGYQDNYHCALPILQKYNVPATIFLATGSLDSGETLWFEKLAETVQRTEREFIDLEIDMPRRFWMRNDAERLASNDGIYGILRGLPQTERQQWLTQIFQYLAVKTERRNMMLTWDQVRFMKTKNIDFGGHTVTHPFISTLTREAIEWEAAESKRRIEQETQLPVDCFAYPSGRERDFGMENKSVIRGAGYKAAVTTIWGMNYPSTDPMELRRGGPWEEDPALFAYKLDWYQLTND